MTRLTRIVPLAHNLLGEVLAAGDLAVDLTAGNGHDTLFLYRAVRPGGRVIAFDIAPAALAATRARLEQAGATVYLATEPGQTEPPSDVTLVAAGHEHCADYLDGAPRGVIANLGYLPGSDRATPTRPEASLTAIRHAAAQLAAGGRIAVVAYPGHAGGDDEARAVADWFAALPRGTWDVLQIAVGNCPQAPLLLVGEKRRR